MKKEYLQIKIENPCEENWDQMIPIQQDKFCGSCEKVVVDFTAMTDGEIVHFYKKNEGSLCGRFHPEQLNRKLYTTRRASSFMAWKAVAALAAGMMMGTQVQGQKELPKIEVSEHSTMVLGGKVSSVSTITGKVIDESGEPLIGAIVVLKDKAGEVLKGTNTDFDGHYTLIKDSRAVSMEVNYVGFDDKVVTDFKTRKHLDFIMNEGVMLGGMMSVGIVYTKVRPITKVKSFFRRLFTKKEKKEICLIDEKEEKTAPSFKQEDKELEEDPNEGLKLSPNPFTSTLNAEIEIPKTGSYLFQLYSITGQLVFAEVKEMYEGQQQVSFSPKSNLAAGNYVFVVTREGLNVYSKQVIKMDIK